MKLFQNIILFKTNDCTSVTVYCLNAKIKKKGIFLERVNFTQFEHTEIGGFFDFLRWITIFNSS